MNGSFNDEEWKTLQHERIKKADQYKISNHGRLMSYKVDPKGKLLKPGWHSGYRTITLPHKDGNRKQVCCYVHRLVAKHFVPKERPEQDQVLHLDFDKANNYYKNLKWATRAEMEEHHEDNPLYVKRFKNNEHPNKGMRTRTKLKPTEVKFIKRKLNDPNRKIRIKMLAKRFGVSEMQIYRIQSGENWADISPDNVTSDKPFDKKK